MFTVYIKINNSEKWAKAIYVNTAVKMQLSSLKLVMIVLNKAMLVLSKRNCFDSSSSVEWHDQMEIH